MAVDTSGLPAGTTFTRIAAGGATTCALDSAGVAYCWGRGGSGQLGNNDTRSSTVPVAVYTSVRFSQISVGFNHVCALSNTSPYAAWCWGHGTQGDLGNNATANSSVPVPVYTTAPSALVGKTLTQITSGYESSCVLSTEVRAYCWGYNYYGQLGNGVTTTSSVPVAVATSAPSALAAMVSGQYLTQISAGDNIGAAGGVSGVNGGFTCAQDSYGTAYCWGYNGSGALGNPATDKNSNYAMAVTAPVAETTSAGNTHSCAIRNKFAYCWGNQQYGALGNGNTTASNVTTPVAVSTGSTWTQISAGGISQYNSSMTITSPSTVAAGDHTCALDSTGAASCWGYNSWAQLGNAGTTNQGAPTAVSVASVWNGGTVTTGAPSGRWFTQISAGSQNTCAIDNYGAAYCAGPNHGSQLGGSTNGTSTINSGPPGNRFNPVYADGALSGKVLVGISVGHRYACAIDTAGAAYCWGDNTNGRLGRGNTTVAAYLAGTVSTSQRFVSIAAGVNSACALNTTGAAYCWGAGTNGALGNGGTTTTGTPTAVSTSGSSALNASTTLAEITVGYNGACATSTAGVAYCWGYNAAASGQVGDGTSTDRNAPVEVYRTGIPLAGAFVTQISMVYSTVCAQDATAASSCWGVGTNGQLGNNNSSTMNRPVGVTSPGPPTSVTAFQGDGTATVYWVAPAAVTGASVTSYTVTAYPPPAAGGSCTLLTATSCKFSGLTNGVSYLITIVAEGTPIRSPVSAMAIVTPWAPARIAAGGSHACTISAGLAYCLGDNTYGQLGDGTTTASKVPVRVSTSGVLAGKTVTQISAGARHTCAVDSTGAAYCWGYNYYGQLGNGTATDSPVPVAVSPGVVPGGRTLTQVSAGAQHTCALDNLGTGYCWGDNSQGELGINTPGGTRTTPVAVTGGLTLAQISADGTDTAPFTNHTCALTTAGAAYCWGDNSRGQVGNNTTTQQNAPVGVTGGALAGKTLAQVTTGAASSCALDSAGLAYCWGDNTYGQLGNNTITSMAQLVPVTVYTAGVLSGVTLAQISGGYRHTCAVASNGWAYCWGFGIDGELGNGGTATTGAAVAVINNGVLYGRVLTQVSAGGSHTCVLDHDGVAYCWGHNTSGQVGNNTYTDATEPVPVSPQAPTIITPVTPVDDTAAISWSVPVFLNSGTITGYTVTATPSPSSGLPSLSCSPASGTTCTVTGLARGVTYTVTVTLTGTINGVPVTSTSPPVTIFIPGFLTITVPDTATLENSAPPGGTASGRLGEVTVTDDRGAAAGSWTVTVSMTDFTSGVAPNVHTIPATAVTYTIAGPPDAFTGVDGTPPANHARPPGITFGAAAPSPARPGNDVAVVTGSGTYAVTWDPAISVAVPRTAMIGTYTATITHSVT